MGRESTPGLEAFRDLERFLADACGTRDNLGVLEPECERRGRELVRLALQSHLDARVDGDAGPSITVEGPDGPVVLGQRRSRTRRIVTLFGAVNICRVGYATPGHPSIYPLDAELGLRRRCWSPEVCRRVVRAAVCGPFDEAVAVISETTGVRISKRSAEQILADAAVDVGSFYAARAGAAPEPGDVLVAAIDCKGVPMVRPEPAPKVIRRRKGQKANKKKMATVGAVHAQAPEPRTTAEVIASLFDPPSPDTPRHPRRPRTNKRVWASLSDSKDTFIADVKAEMCRREPRTGPYLGCGHRRRTGTATPGDQHLRRRGHPGPRPVARARQALESRAPLPPRSQP